VGEAIHHPDELARLDRLCDVHMESGREGATSLVVARMRGDGRRRDSCHPPAGCRANAADQRVSILARHGDIGEQDVDLAFLENLHRLA
jgi:hypothetical protein